MNEIRLGLHLLLIVLMALAYYGESLRDDSETDELALRIDQTTRRLVRATCAGFAAAILWDGYAVVGQKDGLPWLTGALDLVIGALLGFLVAQHPWRAGGHASHS